MKIGVPYDEIVERTKRPELTSPDRERFAELAEGQQPHVTLVTCADSRLDPCAITRTGPGDLFVVRNAGNIVPVSQGGGGELASIEFSVLALKTSHIVVCGHSGCGAMKGLMDPSACSQLKYVGPWVKESEAALAVLESEATDGASPLDRVIEANVRLQLENLRKLEFVQEAEAAGQLSLHGWVYEIGEDKVRVLD